MKTTIHVGYAVGTGEPVAIPLRNTVVVGQTQEAGKTTTLEALAHRSGLTVLAFTTKRGEGAFQNAHKVRPYFRDRADWQFVMGLIEAIMREKNKFLRPVVMKLCRTTKTLDDVQRAVRQKQTSAFIEIDSYLDLVLPVVKAADLAPTLDLAKGTVNVMDLTEFDAPIQMLFMQSAIDYVNARCTNTVVIVPEAWETIPQGRGSPVKASAEELVRKGSAIGNFIWPDSQDTAGIDKTILRGCPVWLIGTQREANEIERNLANIPSPGSRLKPDDLRSLRKGQFYVAFGTALVKTYVQPAWMSAADARAIATGQAEPKARPAAPARASRAAPQPKEDPDVKESEARALRDENGEQKRQIENLTRQVGELQRRLSAMPEPETPKPAGQGRPTLRGDEAPANGAPADVDAIVAEVFRRAAEDPKLLAILATRPEIEITVQRKRIDADPETTYGQIALLVANGFFDGVAKPYHALKEITRVTGKKPRDQTVYDSCDRLTREGFLTKESDGYKAVPGMKVNVIEREAA